MVFSSFFSLLLITLFILNQNKLFHPSKFRARIYCILGDCSFCKLALEFFTAYAIPVLSMIFILFSSSFYFEVVDDYHLWLTYLCHAHSTTDTACERARFVIYPFDEQEKNNNTNNWNLKLNTQHTDKKKSAEKLNVICINSIAI